MLTVQLVGRGRKDIPSDAYNDGQPLRLDVGARIVEILQTTSAPETLPVPSIAAYGTALAIGPSLIGKRHDITITVLTDGGTPSLTCRSSLIDVEVRARADERSDRAQAIQTLLVLAAALLFAGVSAAVGAYSLALGLIAGGGVGSVMGAAWNAIKQLLARPADGGSQGQDRPGHADTTTENSRPHNSI